MKRFAKFLDNKTDCAPSKDTHTHAHPSTSDKALLYGQSLRHIRSSRYKIFGGLTALTQKNRAAPHNKPSEFVHMPESHGEKTHTNT